GAEQAVDYQAAPVESVVRDMDVVFDTVGGAVTERSLLSLRPGGILVTVAGPVPEEKARQMGLRAARGGRSGAEVLPQISALIEADLVKPVVGEVFPLAEAARAQALSQAGHGRGRMILKIGSPEG
ncbi:MAG TPA: zinc-binding dehydrogenase, partial [Anaerolineaceae bacterium]